MEGAAAASSGSGLDGSGLDAAVEAYARMVKPAEVLEALMNDGTFDGLRGKVTAHLKNNDELKQYTQSLVEKSQTLNSAGAEHKTRRELFDALRRELEGPVLDKCSKAAWELILSKDGLGKDVLDSVDATYCKLSQVEAAAAAPPPPMRTPSQERHTMRTPSQERNAGVDAGGANGYYSHPDGRETLKRDRDHRDGSRESERSRERKNRDRDLYERRDAAREYGGGSGSGSGTATGGDYRDYSEGSGRHYDRGRDYRGSDHAPPLPRQRS